MIVRESESHPPILLACVEAESDDDSTDSSGSSSDYSYYGTRHNAGYTPPHSNTVTFVAEIVTR